MDHNLVTKPWGYEYIAYQNSSVAVKVLHIAHGERTSLHCHPNKSTGLVLVDGQAIINFIADQSILTAPAKRMIRRGLFHQTHAISDHGVVMLEIETPVDQDDLVRLKDVYGRTGKGYENSDLPKDDDCLTIEVSTAGTTQYTLGSSRLTVGYAHCFDFDQYKDKDIIMFLQGGVTKIVNGREHLVIQPGDVGEVCVVRQVVAEMDGFQDYTIIMTIQ